MLGSLDGETVLRPCTPEMPADINDLGDSSTQLRFSKASVTPLDDLGMPVARRLEFSSGSHRGCRRRPAQYPRCVDRDLYRSILEVHEFQELCAMVRVHVDACCERAAVLHDRLRSLTFQHGPQHRKCRRKRQKRKKLQRDIHSERIGSDSIGDPLDSKFERANELHPEVPEEYGSCEWPWVADQSCCDNAVLLLREALECDMGRPHPQLGMCDAEVAGALEESACACSVSDNEPHPRRIGLAVDDIISTRQDFREVAQNSVPQQRNTKLGHSYLELVQTILEGQTLQTSSTNARDMGTLIADGAK